MLPWHIALEFNPVIVCHDDEGIMVIVVMIVVVLVVRIFVVLVWNGR